MSNSLSQPKIFHGIKTDPFTCKVSERVIKQSKANIFFSCFGRTMRVVDCVNSSTEQTKKIKIQFLEQILNKSVSTHLKKTLTWRKNQVGIADIIQNTCVLRFDRRRWLTPIFLFFSFCFSNLIIWSQAFSFAVFAPKLAKKLEELSCGWGEFESEETDWSVPVQLCWWPEPQVYDRGGPTCLDLSSNSRRYWIHDHLRRYHKLFGWLATEW